MSTFCFLSLLDESMTPCLDILRALLPHFPTIVYVTGLSGYGGLTVPLALFSDIFNALTLHISLSYLGLKNALSYQIFAMRSLFSLFRGKSVNRSACIFIFDSP